MRYNIEIKPEARTELGKVSIKNASVIKKFWRLLERLEEVGVALPQLKKISGAKNGWRLRFGRYRALLTFKGNTFTVWVVFLKHDPRKDYSKWIKHIRISH